MRDCYYYIKTTIMKIEIKDTKDLGRVLNVLAGDESGTIWMTFWNLNYPCFELTKRY